MPRRPPLPCVAAGCGALVDGGGRCPKHTSERQAAYDRARGSSSARGYGRRWRKLRAFILASEPLCRDCSAHGRVTAATDVDHIVSKRRGGTDDPCNLQPLCGSCHASKTALEDGRWGFRSLVCSAPVRCATPRLSWTTFSSPSGPMRSPTTLKISASVSTSWATPYQVSLRDYGGWHRPEAPRSQADCSPSERPWICAFPRDLRSLGRPIRRGRTRPLYSRKMEAFNRKGLFCSFLMFQERRSPQSVNGSSGVRYCPN